MSLNPTRRAAALDGLRWLRAGDPQRCLLVLARCDVMPPEVALFAVAGLDGKAKPPRGFAWLSTRDFAYGHSEQITAALDEPLVVVDGLHEPMNRESVDLAGWLLEQRHHAGRPTVVSTVLAPNDLGRWLAHHEYAALDSLLARLGHAPSALVVDCARSLLP